MVKVEIRRKGDARPILERISKAIFGPTQVKVGFPAGKAGGDIVARAVYNEFGTSRGIPERPFIRNAMKAGRDEFKAQVTADAKSILNGNMDMEQALSRLGISGQGKIQKEMPNTPPPNHPDTIKQKGSSTTLVDSGQLRAAVTWAIDK